MRKRKKGRKFSMKTGQRKSLLKSLANSFILKEKIETTQARAREISGIVEKMITRAKKGDLASRRLLAKNLSSVAVKKLVDEIAPRHKERRGGYARIVKLGPRKSDAAKMAVIELIK